MKIPIQNVSIKKRVRKNLGDLSQLTASMKRYGLLNPIIISEDNELIAGHRRLEAAKKLGWQEIEVKIYSDTDTVEKLEIELGENMYRKDFTVEEEAEGLERLNKLKNPSLLKRILNAIIRFFRLIFGRHSKK